MTLVITSLVASVALLVGAQEQEHPAVTRVKASVKDPTRPFVMVITFKVKDGAGAKFEAAFAKAVAATRQEKGNRAYELSRSAKDPAEYILYEHWENLTSLEAHLKTDHIKTLGAERAGLVEGQPDVKIFVPTGS